MTTLVAVAARIAVSGNVLCIGSGGISSMMATESIVGQMGIDGGHCPRPWVVEVRVEGCRSAVARFFRPGHRRIAS
ncbi:hypothetical protein P3C38_33830, partial [Mesorhizobium sp. DSM 30133]|nr:hypothetical protein [Mesorhizobium sp. DSM 30133]